MERLIPSWLSMLPWPMMDTRTELLHEFLTNRTQGSLILQRERHMVQSTPSGVPLNVHVDYTFNPSNPPQSFSIPEQPPLGVATIDSNGNLTYVSDALTQVYSVDIPYLLTGTVGGTIGVVTVNVGGASGTAFADVSLNVPFNQTTQVHPGPGLQCYRSYSALQWLDLMGLGYKFFIHTSNGIFRL